MRTEAEATRQGSVRSWSLQLHSLGVVCLLLFIISEHCGSSNPFRVSAIRLLLIFQSPFDPVVTCNFAYLAGTNSAALGKLQHQPSKDTN